MTSPTASYVIRIRKEIRDLENERLPYADWFTKRLKRLKMNPLSPRNAWVLRLSLLILVVYLGACYASWRMAWSYSIPPATYSHITELTTSPVPPFVFLEFVLWRKSRVCVSLCVVYSPFRAAMCSSSFVHTSDRTLHLVAF